MGGATVQWLRDGLGIIRSSDEIEALAASVPDTGDVYLVPAFAGLGAPQWDAAARGTIVGLTRGIESRAYRARRAREHRVPDRRSHRGHAAGRGPAAVGAARRRRRGAQRPAAAIPGRPAGRAGAAAREHRNHGIRRGGTCRARRRILAIAGRSSRRFGRSTSASSRACRAPKRRNGARAGTRPWSARAHWARVDLKQGRAATRGSVRRPAGRTAGAGLPSAQYRATPRFLHARSGSEFVALFADAARRRTRRGTRGELDELLALQQRRTPRDVEAARADRKTEVWQFAAALGLKPATDARLARARELCRAASKTISAPTCARPRSASCACGPTKSSRDSSPASTTCAATCPIPAVTPPMAMSWRYLLSPTWCRNAARSSWRVRRSSRGSAWCAACIFRATSTPGRIGAEWLAQRLLASADYRADAAWPRAELQRAR